MLLKSLQKGPVHLEEQRSVLFCRLNEPKKTSARSARARSAAKPTNLYIFREEGEGEGGRGGGRGGAKGRGMMFVCSPSQLGINAQQTGE
jgi:hypothetical protein